MNKKGAISIFLVIITSAVLASFLILFQYYSIALLETDVNRSASLVSRNILAKYEDEIYDHYGILAYQRTDESSIAEDLMKTFNNFSSPVNLYKVKKITVNYETKGMNYYRILLDQITYFSKNKISLNLAKDIFTRIGKSNLYIEKTREIQKKLEGNKGYDALKKIHRNLKSGKDTLESLERNAHSYLEVIELYEKSIHTIKNIEIDEAIEDLQEGIDGLKNAYENSYVKITLEYKKMKEIIGLKKSIEINKKQINSIRLDESLLDQEKSVRIEKLRNEISLLEEESDLNIKALKSLINDYEKGISIKERLGQLKDGIKGAKEVFGYGTIEDYLSEREEGNIEIAFNEQLLLNEYILGTFKSIIKSDYRDFNFYLKEARVSKSNGEVEYIIKGYQDSIKNIAAVSKDVFLIREAMNLSHLFIDHKKREFIFNTAKAPAIGVFAAAGLTGLWTTAESSIDLYKIYNGNGTALLKISEKDFVLDLGIILDGASINYQSINREGMMYYHDYLRVFLYRMDEQVKLDRILDVINTQFPIDSLVLKHKIDARFIFTNKITGTEKEIMTSITEGYIYE